jgi:tetratricopeptide (TPR) repeat protein
VSNEPDVLEKNVSTLLETGGEAPRLSAAARTRIKSALVAKHAVTAVPAWRGRNVAIGGGMLLAAAAVALYVTSRGGRAGLVAPAPADDALALADGTTVVRESGATVTVIGPRHVRVTGEALLDVVPGKGTFVVDTARGRIEVLGTRFVVDGEAEKTTAAVVRGEVKLIANGGDVLLHAGEQGIAEPGKPPTRGPAPRLSHLVSWAQATRRKLEHDQPVHHGTLFARQPNNPGAAEEPLPLAKLMVDVVVDNQVARVALDQTFHNPSPQELEGVYRFAIPPDAALQRLAMYVDGKLEESAVVERMAARRIYEEQVYRRVDPALLEWAGTGKLNLRVYPLHGDQDKRLVLAYTQSLPKLYDDWTLTVPLPEVDQPVGELGFTVRVKGCANCELTSPSHAITVTRSGDDALLSYTQTGARAGDSLVVHVRDTRHTPHVATYKDGAESYLMVRAPADLAAGPTTYRPRNWVILDDVSASRDAMARRAQADLIDGFLRELDENDHVSVVAFDVTARVALPATRVLDVDRPAVRKALADEGDVGATDFGVALDAALAQLGGTAPDDAMIVYLGDGVITSGARHLDELRAKIVGKAHFVGVGVGDAADTQTLDSLAAATGGYATTIDLADDVGWRAFDLVAALHTARVTGIQGKLVDAHGAPVAATLYAPAQLADGEELELTAKFGSTAVPAALELTGTLAGQPWSRHIALDDGGLPPGGSGAEWRRGSIDAPAGGDAGYLPRLWAQRHIAARLLAKHEPVPDGETRDARDEVIRREVVELGKKYFLLSRHTSLLVLENDAMYAQYGITKGTGQTWAPYALPPTMPIVRTAANAAISTMTPADVAPDAELVRQPVPVFYTPPSYGWYSNVPPVALGAGTTRAGGEDLLGAASAGSATYYAGPRVVAKSEAVSDRSGDADNYDSHHEKGEQQAQVETTKDLSPPPAATATPTMALDEGKMGKNEVASEAFADKTYERQGMSNGYGVGGGRGGLGYGYGYGTTSFTLLRFANPNDSGYDDLTAFVPALFPDAADTWRKQLGAADTKPHAIDDAARTRLEAARKALPSGVYRWGDLEIAVDDARRLGWRRTTDADLAETASFDGATWTRRYAELGLDATRAVGDDDIALALGYLPVWIASPDHYAKYFTVRAQGDHDVVLARGDHVAYILGFDGASHLTSVRDGGGHELISVTWTPAGPSAAHVGGEDIDVGFTGQAITDAPAWAHRDAPASAVVVELPARVPAYWDTQRASAAVGSPAWRHATRQQLVSLAAIHASPKLYADYTELAAHGGVEVGDVVLASEGIAMRASKADLAALPASPVAHYLATPVQPARAAEPGLIGALTTLRGEVNELSQGHSSSAADLITQLGSRAPQLRLIGAAAMASYDTRPQDRARAWDTFSSGPYRNIARDQAAQAYVAMNQLDEATTRYAALAEDYDVHALPVDFANARYAFASSRRGNAGWEIASAKLRERVLAGGGYAHVLGLVSWTDAQPDRLRLLSRAAELANGDTTRIAEVAQHAANVGELAWAAALIQPIVLSSPTRELCQLAGRFALQQGRLGDALANLEQAQALAADEPASLQVVRAELAEIIDTAKRLALQSNGGMRTDATNRALRWGKRWREIDPGNPQIDTELGDMLLAVGDPTEAWRQMSTLIERDPMSGTGYETVAGVFEREGKAAEALDYWEQALRIDQTDPTPRLRKAQALFALGRNKEGYAALRDITSKHWHERWEWIVEQARELQGENHGG